MTHQITIRPNKDVLLEALYGGKLNAEFIKAAESGDTATMVSAISQGVKLYDEHDLGEAAYNRAKNNGHYETANTLKSFMK